MNKRLIRRLAIVGSAVVIAAPFLAATPSAMADSISVTTGTWAQSSPPGGGNPPPNFPEGGMWASASGTQDLAVAAVAFPAAGNEATLTLHVHQATPPPLPGVSYTIGLCLADPPTWKPPAASPGAMSDAPKRNCDGGHEIDSKAIVDASNAVLFRVELTSALISTDASGQKAFNFEIFVKSDEVGDGFAASGSPSSPPPSIDLQFEKVNPATDIFVLGAEPSDSSSSSADSGPIASSDTVAPSTSASDSGSSNSLSAGSVSGVGGAPLPGVSFTDTPSTPAANAATPAASPQASPGNTTRSLPLRPTANKGPSDRDRILLGLLMLGLIGWTLIRDQLPSANRKPSLYDLPAKSS